MKSGSISLAFYLKMNYPIIVRLVSKEKQMGLNRFQYFNKMIKEHPWYSGKQIKSILTPLVKREVKNFIKQYGHEPSKDFRARVAVLYVDQPNKPKGWTLVTELLLAMESLCMDGKK